MGPLAAIPRIPQLLVTMWRTAAHLAAEKPDLIVLVDFGAFNMRLAKTLRTRLKYAGPIIYFFRRQRGSTKRASRARSAR